jgi:hypothetical protein
MCFNDNVRLVFICIVESSPKMATSDYVVANYTKSWHNSLDINVVLAIVSFISEIYIIIVVIYFIYCAVIINLGIPIFADFVVNLDHENKNPTKYNSPHWLFCVVFEATHSISHGSMHFVETTTIGTNE